jgi:hypothetical protein
MVAGEQGKQQKLNVFDFKGPGISMAMYNTEEVRHCRSLANLLRPLTILLVYVFMCI